MWRVEQEHDVIEIFYYARVWHHQVAPNSKVRDMVREETAESTSGEHCPPSSFVFVYVLFCFFLDLD